MDHHLNLEVTTENPSLGGSGPDWGQLLSVSDAAGAVVTNRHHTRIIPTFQHSLILRSYHEPKWLQRPWP